MSEVNELAAALSKAQGAVENAKKLSKNPHFRSNYADLASIWDAIREHFSAQGLSVMQLPYDAGPGLVGLRTLVLHSSGQSIESSFSVALKDTTNPQQVGSCLTYMKRYALMGVAGIASEDDDGNAATGRAEVDSLGAQQRRHESLMKRLDAASEAEALDLVKSVKNSSLSGAEKALLIADISSFIFTKFQPSAKKEKVMNHG